MPSTPARLYYVNAAPEEGWTALGREAHGLGFDHVLLDCRFLGQPEPFRQAVVQQALAGCGESGLTVFADLDLYEFDARHPLVERHPDWFAVRCRGEGVTDPRKPFAADGKAYARPYVDAAGFSGFYLDRIGEWRAAGIAGFRLLHPHRIGNAILKNVMEKARARWGLVFFLADTPGLTRGEADSLAGIPFDGTLSSLPWWDGHASWMLDEYRALQRIAPVLALVEAPACAAPASLEARHARLALAAATGTGLLMPRLFASLDGGATTAAERMGGGLADWIRAANAVVQAAAEPSSLYALTGPGAGASIVVRDAGEDAMIAVINPGASAERIAFETHLGPWQQLEPVPPFSGEAGAWAPGEVRLFRALKAKPSRLALPKNALSAAVKTPRIVIAAVAPTVEQGAFALKRIVGDTLSVDATIFTDGHPELRGQLLHRYGDEVWQSVALTALGNDRWRGAYVLQRVGRAEFAIEAWIDCYGGFASDLAKKHAAGKDIALDLEEGRGLIEDLRPSAQGNVRAALDTILAAFDTHDAPARFQLLTAGETLDTMRLASPREWLARSAVFPIEVDRPAAAFSSWYELFPRSQSNDAQRHGTFADVAARLPAIRDMGFDVLYFPPVHPIGRTHRKGRNNSLQAEAGDPGSPYAIGSEEGGHDAIHPELGSLEDFVALVKEARAHGLDIALDFAVQCSPDHPWLKEHPEWFDWRANGSIKYAENPPKVYEDIVNVDFHETEGAPALWRSLRDVVRHWLKQGVKIFRVDNPHTKPFAFWRWLIADIKAVDPDAIFLAEAFTRPSIMHHLAKLGFAQSYTYFTWRNGKAELTEYLSELSQPPVSDFFRPNFFVNTPDINPFFLQVSGRPGFLIRACLAATLSGAWGLYSGFELCEAEALKDREEYADSEKYEIKPRDWNAPGNIVADIAALNRIRRAEPALQRVTGLTFYTMLNGNILYYGKHSAPARARILVAVSLNPHGAEAGDFELPLWEWGLPDDGALAMEDLLNGQSFVWRGKMQRLHLTPDAPYRIWRAQPLGDA